jgi:hypothetical protein
MATDSPPSADQKPPKLRWYQYRLRSLFVLTTLVAVACSWLAVMMMKVEGGGRKVRSTRYGVRSMEWSGRRREVLAERFCWFRIAYFRR